MQTIMLHDIIQITVQIEQAITYYYTVSALAAKDNLVLRVAHALRHFVVSTLLPRIQLEFLK